MTREESRVIEKKILEDCKSTVDGATDEDVNNILDHEPPKTHSAKCLAACGQQKIGLIVDGKVSAEGAKALGAKKYENNEKAIGIWNEIVGECSEIADDDNCELAAKFIDCTISAATKRGVDPKKGIEV